MLFPVTLISKDKGQPAVQRRTALVGIWLRYDIDVIGKVQMIGIDIQDIGEKLAQLVLISEVKEAIDRRHADFFGEDFAKPRRGRRWRRYLTVIERGAYQDFAFREAVLTMV